MLIAKPGNPMQSRAGGGVGVAGGGGGIQMAPSSLSSLLMLHSSLIGT